MKTRDMRLAFHDLSVRHAELETQNQELQANVQELQANLREARDTIEAIRTGAVDAIVVSGGKGEQIFTLQGPDTPYRAIIETMNEGVVTLDDTGTMMYCNARFSDMLGMPMERLVGSPLLPYVEKGYAKAFNALLESTRTGAAGGEIHLTAGDGLSVPVYVSANGRSALHAGASVCLLLTDIRELAAARDELTTSHAKLERRVAERTEEILDANQRLRTEIEERKKLEEMLRAREERYRRLYTEAAIGIFHSTFDDRFIDVNPALAEMLGYDSPEEVLESIHSISRQIYVDPPRRDHLLQRTLEEGKTIVVENQYRRRSGEEWLAYLFLRRVNDATGKPLYLEGFVQDITERKRMEEELRKSREELEQRVEERTSELTYERQFLQTIVDNIPVMLTVHTRGRQVPVVNKEVERLLGWSQHDLGHIDLMSELYPDPEYRKEMWEYMSAPGPRWKDIKMRARDGRTLETRWMNIEVSEDIRIGIGLDVTERNSVEEQLRQAQKMEAIGLLAGGIAHDFNNMLAVIMGNAELALDDIPEDEHPRHNLEAIVKASKRCRDLVRQILTFSRKDASQQKDQPLTPLLEESFKLLRASIPSTIEMKLDVNTESDIARVNEAQFQQIIMNLCTNAAFAMREKGGALHLSLDNETLDDASGTDPLRYLKLTVTDTGTGMDEVVKKRIFDPFFTTKKMGEGSGMGLAVVHGIVEAHNGLITVHSEPGKGSSFSVLIPRTTEKVVLEGKSPSAVCGGRERILFVDDETSIVDIGTVLLKRLGYEVSCFTDPLDALDSFTKAPHDFDLVITDQTMPKITGAVLAGKLKAIRSDIPVMLCTGYSQTVSAEQARSQGIEGYVIKPFVKRELAEAIRKILDQGNLQQPPVLP